MSEFSEYIDAVLQGADDLATNLFKGLADEARQDTKAFLERMKDDLQRWTKLLNTRLTQEDFRDLVQAKKALAEMRALTEAGAALASLQRFRDGLIDVMIDRAFALFL